MYHLLSKKEAILWGWPLLNPKILLGSGILFLGVCLGSSSGETTSHTGQFDSADDGLLGGNDFEVFERQGTYLHGFAKAKVGNVDVENVGDVIVEAFYLEFAEFLAHFTTVFHTS